MIKNVLRQQKKKVAVYACLLWAVMSVLFLAVTAYMQYNAKQLQINEIEIGEQNLLTVEKTVINNRLNKLADDLLFVADSLALGDDMKVTVEDFQRLWIAFADRMGIYHQIRYLDMDGNEVIRINHDSTRTYAEAEALLQNKGDRYYFLKTVQLQKNAIYISPMDLNVEFGEIEQPYRPMLRLGTPYFNGDGEQKGIVVLNYLASDLLSRFRITANASQGALYLLNADGYWLSNAQDPATEWAFMFDDRKDISFASEYPLEWEAITQNRSGYIRTDNGVFIYTSLIPSTEIGGEGEISGVVCDSDALYLVSVIAADSDAGLLILQNGWDGLPALLSRYAVVYCLMAVLSLGAAVLLVINRMQKAEIKYFSEYDALTGIYNRRAAYNKLYALKTDAAKQACNVTVCFIDINGLKEVNDFLGHDTGDELIKSVASVLKDSVRSNDYVARLGGDEFLIIFENQSADSAENIWNRIAGRFEEINARENRDYVISVSHGVGTVPCSAGTSVDRVIQQADETMYKEKRELKQGLRVIRRETRTEP